MNSVDKKIMGKISHSFSYGSPHNDSSVTKMEQMRNHEGHEEHEGC